MANKSLPSRASHGGDFSPDEIVKSLDQYIVGQYDAKRSIAIAIVNRRRRAILRNKAIYNEIIPKNILMIGPTGVGKSEMIKRIIAMNQNTPFIKVDAVKFTEIGYVGHDVESIVRNLADMTFNKLRTKAMKAQRAAGLREARHIVVDILLQDEIDNSSKNRAALMNKLKLHQLDHKFIEIDIPQRGGQYHIDVTGSSFGVITANDILSKISDLEDNKSHKKVKVPEALDLLTNEACNRIVEDHKIIADTIRFVENDAIVFIDEIDKLISTSNSGSRGEISREGVQRDLLAIIGGSDVQTKYGSINTSNMMFIGAGAFHGVKPSDLLPELQGRLPIQIQMKPLTKEDMLKILTVPKYNLIEQYKALLGAEGIKIRFMTSGLNAIAHSAVQMNNGTDNIGARRLHQVVDKVLENVSFDSNAKNTMTIIDDEYVNKQLESIINAYAPKKETYII